VAKPQLEDGHTRIANEILEAFCHAFPGGANAQVLLAIIRRTYGWNKKQDSISIGQLEEMTGLSRRAVIYALQNLEAQKFITVQRQRGRGNFNQVNTVAFQKNYDLWVVQRNSPQYEKQLQKQREKYYGGVVQRKRGGSAKNELNEAGNSSAKKKGSAKNDQKVVQRNDKKGQFFAPTKDIKKCTKDIKRMYKRKYGEFNNVLLTDEEYQRLKDKFGVVALDWIETLSRGIESKGYKYQSHYATILNWERREKEKGGQSGAHRQNTRGLPTTYTTPEEARRQSQRT